MHWRYVRLLITSCIGAVLLAAAVNYVVDPYGLHRWIERDGFNRRKPKAGLSTDLVKPYDVLRVRPRTLLLGSSRAETGIDPDDPVWPEAMRPVYNLALRGRGIDAGYKSLRHVLQALKPDTVIVGLELVDFIVREPAAGATPAAAPEVPEFERRLLADSDGAPNPEYRLQSIKDQISSLFSLNALVDSVLTLALQGRAGQPDLTPHGFNPMHEYEPVVRLEGHYSLFRQIETNYLSIYIRSPKTVYARGTTRSTELDRVRALIKLCRDSGVRLLLYIHPSHAHVLEAYRIAGLWPTFEEWKRALVAIVEEDARAHPHAAPIALWDFGAYDEFTTERVPSALEKGVKMRWFWEAGHYKAELGRLMVARMLGAAQPGGFGAILDRHNLEPRLAEIRAGQRRYEALRADEVAGLEALAREIRARAAPRH